MKSQKIYRIGCGLILLVALLTVRQVDVWAEVQQKQWVIIHNQISENAMRYSVALKYVPSEKTFCGVPQRNIRSVALPESEQIDNYKERIDLGTALDGFKYSMLLGDARELCIINRNGRQICKAKILRSKQDNGSEIVKEGYFFLGNQIEIPFEVPKQQLALPTTEPVSGTLSINIHDSDSSSYQGSVSTILRGSLTGSAFIEDVALEVSVSPRESLRPDDWCVNLAVQSLDDKIPLDSTSGKIMDVLKLRSATLVVEKIASDSSEIVLATLDGDISKAKEEWLKSHLSIGKPIPTFARVDLLRRRLLTLDEFCKKARTERHIVLIFGDFKREYGEYGYRRNQLTRELTLDETMILEILQRDLKYPPIVVFVCCQFSLSDLYEKWLGQEPDFSIIADYSNPMDVQFWLPYPYSHQYYRPPAKMETLREQFVLPENKVSVLLVDGKGNLVYINADAGQQLAASLTEINKLIASKK